MLVASNRWRLAASVAVPLIGGTTAGTLATKSAKRKYHRLDTPRFSPPSWVFPVAWTSLYVTMGTAKYLFDKEKKPAALQQQANMTYSVQLGRNYLWSFLFFRWNLRGTAFIEAAMLWSAVTLNTYYFYRKSRLAGTLMIPYIAWVSFALALNYVVWKDNQDV